MSVAVVRRLDRTDAAAFRAVRLESLLAHPTAYGMAHGDEAALPIETFAQRLTEPPPNAAFGGFDGDALVGIVRVVVQPRIKLRHRGTVVGVYVRGTHRGTGLSGGLMRAAIAQARADGLEAMTLTVAVGNDPARALYVRLGFVPYGVDPRALKWEGAYVDEELMALDLT